MNDFSLKVGVKADTSDIQSQLNKMSPKATVETKVKFNGNDAVKEITTYTDKLNHTVTATKILDTSGKTLSNTITRIKTDFKDTSDSATKASVSLDKTSKSAKSISDNFNHASREGMSLADKFVDITKKVLAFGTVTQIIMLFRQSINEAVTSVREMDSALIELRKVSDLSGEGLKNYTKDAFDLAKQLHTTASSVTEAVTEFSKSGYDVEQSKALAEQAIVFQTIADGEIRASDAATTLIQVMKAYNMTTEDSVHVVDALNEVSNNYAVSSTDLSASIGKVASSASMAGVDFNHLLGLITSSTEVTQNASKSANGFKSILVNLMSDKYEKQFNQFGLSMRDTNGAMKDGFTILEELSGKYKSLGERLDETGEFSISLNDDMNKLLTDIGGKHNINVLTASLGNFGQALNVVESAIGSAGSAQNEYQIALDGITKKLDALKGQFQELVYGKGGLSNFIKFVIDTGTEMLKFANSDIGQVIIKTTAFLAGLVLLNKGTTLLKGGLSRLSAELLLLKSSTLMSSIGVFALEASANGLSSAFAHLNISTKALTASLLSNPLFIGAAAIGIVFGVVKAIDALTTSTSEAKEIVTEYSQEYENLSSKISTTEAELEKIKNKISEIRSLDGLNLTKEGELNSLIEQSVELERQLAIQRLLREEARLKAEEAAKQVISSQVSSDTLIVDQLSGEMIETVSPVENLKAITEELAKLKEEQRNLDVESKNFISTSTSLKERIDDLTAAGAEQVSMLEENANALTSTDEKTVELKDLIYKLIDGFIDLTEISSETSKKIENSFEEVENGSSALESLAESLNMTVEEFENQADAMGLTSDQFGDYAKNAQDIASETDRVNDAIDGIQSALSIAERAFDEYNNSGSLTLDTFQSLMSLSPEYISSLIDENGQIRQNEDALYSLTEQLKQTKIEELQNAMAADLLALSQGNVSGMSNLARGAIADVGTKASVAGNQALTASGKLMSLANSAKSLFDAAAGKVFTNEFKLQASAITGAYEEAIAGINKISVTLKSPSSGGGGGGGGSGKKSGGGKGGGGGSGGSSKEKTAAEIAKDEAKAWKDSYDKQISDYKHKLEMDSISDAEYYKEFKRLNEEYFGESSKFHDEYIGEYRKGQEELYKWEKKQREEALEDQKEKYEQAIDHINRQLDKQLDDLKEERDEELDYIDSKIDKLEEKKEAELKSIKDTINALKKEKEEFEKNIESKIDSLDELKDKEKEEWDAKIDAFKEQNKLLDEQNELQKLQESLAKAKSSKVKIYSGNKFTYGMDESAIADAEQAIEDYYTQRKQEEELKALEDARDKASENYQKQIDDLKKYKDTMKTQYEEKLEYLDLHYEKIEEKYDLDIEKMEKHRDEVQREYEEQIQDMEDYIDEFEDMVDSYEDEQDRLAFEQLTGTKNESENWTTRLSNLSKFVKEYNNLLKELDKEESGGSSSSNDNSNSSSGGSGGGVQNKVEGFGGGPGVYQDENGTIHKRASGDSYIKKNGAYVVGENPNKEILIGSKLNNGTMTQLSKGDGVVNAKSTTTLAGILNSIGSQSSVTSNLKLNDKKDGYSNHLTIDKVYVQSNNATEFLESMSREFKINMKQEAFNPL